LRETGVWRVSAKGLIIERSPVWNECRITI